MSIGVNSSTQMGVQAEVMVRTDDADLDVDTSIYAVVPVLRAAVEGALLGAGFAAKTVDEAIKNFGTMEV